MLSNSLHQAHVGGENCVLARSCGNAQEIAILKLAERVGFLERDFAKPNEINGFAIISRNRNDLASSNLRRRFRPFAGFCRFFYFNGTRHGTRLGDRPRVRICALELGELYASRPSAKACRPLEVRFR